MMRAALWFVGLFALAVAMALFTGSNHAVVSLFWHPYRVDVSLNMALLLLLALFILLYIALRGAAALGNLPLQARHWRQQQKERAMYQALVDGMAHLQAGRFVRARKSAQIVLDLLDELRAISTAALPNTLPLGSIAHMLAAESSHALRDLPARETHYTQALADAPATGSHQQQQVREGAQMRAARWALDDRDPREALQRLTQLPQGTARRTMALRIRLKASRLAGETRSALETARLLAKHGGFSPEAAQSIIRGLLTEQIHDAGDSEQLQTIWNGMHATEQANPDLAITAARKLMHLCGDAPIARQWLLPVWQAHLDSSHALSAVQMDRLITVLQQCLDKLDAQWLARIENAHRQYPQNAHLQYLAGMACVQRQLWGRGELLLQQASQHLHPGALRAHAWKTMALLAEQRHDAATAAHAWREAACSTAAISPDMTTYPRGR